MKIFISILFILFSAEIVSPFQADPFESDEIESVIHEFFDGMRAAEGSSIKSLITEEATLHTVTSDEGEPVLRETPMNRFIESVGSTEPGTLDEQLTFLQIHVDAPLATAWMEYRFYNSGEFSHCGVNTMNLIKKEDGWKIFSIVDTRRTTGC